MRTGGVLAVDELETQWIGRGGGAMLDGENEASPWRPEVI
jgi:hypothetical protein